MILVGHFYEEKQKELKEMQQVAESSGTNTGSGKAGASKTIRISNSDTE